VGEVVSSIMAHRVTDFGRDCTYETVDGTKTCASLDIDELPEGINYTWTHLHLEVFMARGFRDFNDAIRINPSLMFTNDSLNQLVDRMDSYYPIARRILGWDEFQYTLEEQIPFDFVDTEAVPSESRRDTDFGIIGSVSPDSHSGASELTLFMPAGDVPANEDRSLLFWTRFTPATSGETCPPTSDWRVGVQNICQSGPEWTESTFVEVSDLLNYLFASQPEVYQRGTTYVGSAPYCTNVYVDSLISTDLICNNIQQDDANWDIPSKAN
jgi:hypothetical protein